MDSEHGFSSAYIDVSPRLCVTEKKTKNIVVKLGHVTTCTPSKLACVCLAPVRSMAELAQPSSLLLSGAETDFSRPGSYGSVSQDHVIRFSDHKSSSEKAPDEAEAEEKEFPWIQTTLISSAMVGIVVVMVVFAHDTSPWQDFFNRGAGHVLVDLCAAFLFFASSDVFAQILPAMYAGQGFGRTNDLHATILKQARAHACLRGSTCAC